MTTQPPFDTQRLDALLEEEGVDALLVTSPHNLGYFLGGYRFVLYDKLDSVGLSRYSPFLGYVRGRADQSFYVGWGDEGWGVAADPIWPPEVRIESWTAEDAAATAARLLETRLGRDARVGIEKPYVSIDAFERLRAGLPEARFESSVILLDELRAIKTPEEIEAMTIGAEKVVEAMSLVFSSLEPGETTRELAERLRVHESQLGLEFHYCLIAAAPDANRAPSAQRLDRAAALSLDSGASYQGFVADIARMGVYGEPTQLQKELLAMVRRVQEAARAEVRAGALSAELMEAGRSAVEEMPWPERFNFVAHGMGRKAHEAPRLNQGKPPYPASHLDEPLAAGMVLSIETHVIDPEAGFVKLEDAVAVTAEGCEPLGDGGRDWNVRPEDA